MAKSHDDKSIKSANKAFFLTQEYYLALPLQAAGLPKIVSHFEKKHKIKIFINGATDVGKKFIDENKKQINTSDPQYSEKIKDICLDTSQALQEVEAIQKTLKPNEYVGYMYTNHHQVKADHMECVIISHDFIARPLNWKAVAIDKTFNMSSFNTVISDDNFNPQCTDSAGCGTLCIQYLKELLKNESNQLKNYCLSFSCYTEYMENYTFEKLFFPSPQVLRYSQSDLYVQYIEKMLSEDNEFTLIKNDGTKPRKITCKPLKKILEDSVKYAQENKDENTAKANEEILKQLPEFRKKWLEEYKHSQSKRNQMIGSRGINRYLVYRTNKLNEIANKADSDNKSVPINKANKK